MINDIFYNQVKRYNPTTILEIKNAMKEVLQDIILCGLGKSDFFNHAVFYGGTSLRIFRGLQRFSEDLDFTLDKKCDSFDFDNYLNYSKKELESLNIECDIYSKEKSTNTTVVSRYFRFNLRYLFEISYKEYADKIISNELLSIKIEMEKDVFSGGIFELKLLTYPSFVQIRTFNMETLFASKLMAVLNRKWKSRIKGRDFYDYLFYVYNKTKINISFLENGLKKFGYLYENDKLTIELLKERLKERFEEIDFDSALKDVLPFLSKDDLFIHSFNKEIFIGTIDLLKTI